MNFRMQRRVYY